MDSTSTTTWDALLYCDYFCPPAIEPMVHCWNPAQWINGGFITGTFETDGFVLEVNGLLSSGWVVILAPIPSITMAIMTGVIAATTGASD